MLQHLREMRSTRRECDDGCDRSAARSYRIPVTKQSARGPLELLGKGLGMFIDRKEVGGPNEFARMGNEELDAFLREHIESLPLLHNGGSKQ